MDRNIDFVKQYHKGEILRADDVNALIRASKRRMPFDGCVAVGDSDAMAFAPPIVPRSLELDGPQYDIQVRVEHIGNVLWDSYIPPYSQIVPTTSYSYPSGFSVPRAHDVRVWDSGITPHEYVSAFLTTGPGPILQRTLGNGQFGTASLLFNGGWAAYNYDATSKAGVDEFGNQYAPDTNTENNINGGGRVDIEWGPKPGSYLLWPNRNGYRCLGGAHNIPDPLGGSDIWVAYFYQIPRASRGYLWAGFSGLLINFTTPTIQGMGQVTNDSLHWYATGYPDGVNTIAEQPGMYEWMLTFEVTPSFAGSASQSQVLSITPYRKEQGSTLTQIAPTKTFTVNIITDHANATIALHRACIMSGWANFHKGDYLAFKMSLDATTNSFQVTLDGDLRMRKIDDIHYNDHNM